MVVIEANETVLLAMNQNSLSCTIPFDDSDVDREGMDDAKPTQVVPRDTLASSVVGRNLAAHFLRNRDSLGHRVVPKEEHPIRLPVSPGGGGNTVRTRALGDVGLLDIAGVLI